MVWSSAVRALALLVNKLLSSQSACGFKLGHAGRNPEDRVCCSVRLSGVFQARVSQPSPSPTPRPLDNSKPCKREHTFDSSVFNSMTGHTERL